MMKKLYKEQKHSIYEMQRVLGLSKLALYNYVNGTYSIDSMKIGILIDLARFEGIEPIELYRKIKDRENEEKKI